MFPEMANGRTAAQQAGAQIVSLIITIAMALVRCCSGELIAESLDRFFIFIQFLNSISVVILLV